MKTVLVAQLVDRTQCKLMVAANLSHAALLQLTSSVLANGLNEGLDLDDIIEEANKVRFSGRGTIAPPVVICGGTG